MERARLGECGDPNISGLLGDFRAERSRRGGEEQRAGSSGLGGMGGSSGLRGKDGSHG